MQPELAFILLHVLLISGIPVIGGTQIHPDVCSELNGQNEQ